MGEKNTQSNRPICRKPLSIFLFIAILGVFFTWFNLLQSIYHPLVLDQSVSVNKNVMFVSADQVDRRHKHDDFLLPYPQEFASSFDNNGTKAQDTQSCDPSRGLLKVFMYDLPPEFHFGLLGWDQAQEDNVWPDIRTNIPRYPGGLNVQHSIEYWLTLDLLSSKCADRSSPCSAVRVTDSSEADVVFVPFFSSLSYNRQLRVKRTTSIDRNMLLQDKLVKFLKGQKEWMRTGGRDHIIVAHHPNSMRHARMKLSSSIFILADFGRYAPATANIDKDVIVPYKHLVGTFVNDSSGFDDRPTLIYFRGAIFRKDGGIIRQKLFNILRGSPEVHFSFGTIDGQGIPEAARGMRSSKFCLHIAGDTPSSNRLFDAIASHCVPIVVSDRIELPYEDILDYSEFCIFVRSTDAVKKDFLIKLIRGITKQEWTRMWERLKELDRCFEYQYPSQKDDAVQMIWQAVARKVSSVKRKLHRSRRFTRSDVEI